MNARNVFDEMLSFILKEFMSCTTESMDIHITHDWNMFLLKEIGLGLAHESYGDIEYLEGIVFMKFKYKCDHMKYINLQYFGFNDNNILNEING